MREATDDREGRMKAKNHYNFKSEFEIRRDKLLYQYFGCQNDPTSRPPLELIHLGTNTTNGTTSPSDSIPFVKKTPKPMPLTIPTNLPEIPTNLSGHPYPYTPLSDSLKK